MKISQAARIADASRAAYFAYWLCLTLGLTAACIVLDLPWPRSWALAAGTLAGTGLGQLCAWGRYRLWAAMTIGATALFFVVIALSIGQAVLTSSEYGCLAGPPAALARDLLVWNEGWLGFMAYVPAGLSGYLLVTEYGSFASLWFPLTFWMLPILEPSRGLLRPWVLVASAPVASVCSPALASWARPSSCMFSWAWRADAWRHRLARPASLAAGDLGCGGSGRANHSASRWRELSLLPVRRRGRSRTYA